MRSDNNELLKDSMEWDVFNWSNALVHWSGVVKSLHKDAKILCLGERNGGLSLWFALQGFSVICSDYGGPTEEAKMLHSKYGVSGNIEYADLSIFSLPYSSESFDIVACKSVVGGLKLNYKDRTTRTLQNQKLAMDEVRRVLKTGGYFLGAENMRGSWVHSLARGILKGKKIGWRHFKVPEFKYLLQDFKSSDLLFFGFFGTYYPVRWLNQVLAKIDFIFSKFLPDAMLYIGFIRAKK